MILVDVAAADLRLLSVTAVPRKQNSTTPSVNPLHAKILAMLEAQADEAAAASYRKIAPGSKRVLGIRVPALRSLANEVARGLDSGGALDFDGALELADHAFEGDCREEMLLAVFLVARFKKELTPELWPRVDKWIDGITNWETCDQLAMNVAGEIVARAPAPVREKLVKALVRWAGSNNPWRRRFAAASTTALNQKGRCDAQTALRVCEQLLADEEETVRKAVAWALREASDSDPEAVATFLSDHKGNMPPGVLRASAEKLPAAQRKRLGVA